MNLRDVLNGVRDHVAALYADVDPVPTVVARFVPVSDLDKIPELEIDVTPGKADYDLANRSETSRDQVIAIVFRQKLPKGVNPEDESGNEWIDGRFSLVQRTVASFTGDDFRATGKELGIVLTELEHAIYDPELMKGKKLFSSTVVLTFLAFE